MAKPCNEKGIWSAVLMDCHLLLCFKGLRSLENCQENVTAEQETAVEAQKEQCQANNVEALNKFRETISTTTLFVQSTLLKSYVEENNDGMKFLTM